MSRDPIQPHSMLGRDITQKPFGTVVPILQVMTTMGDKLLEQV